MASVVTAQISPEQTLDLESLQDFDEMPHAVDDWEKEKEDDEEVIQRLLAGSGQENDDLAALEQDLENQGGDKAVDAEDYGDISDEDDLPDEEVPTQAPETQPAVEGQLEDLFGDDGEFDDLFGETDTFTSKEGGTASEINGTERTSSDAHHAQEEARQSPGLAELSADNDTVPIDIEEELDPLALEQRRMFEAHRDRLARGGIDPDAGPAPQTNSDLLETLWPGFERTEIPEFTKLFMKKRAYYMTRQPHKAPVKIQPARPTFDLIPDQERTFKLSSGPQSRKRANEEVSEHSTLFIHNEDHADQTSDEDVDLASLDGNEIIGGVSVQDLRILCENWDTISAESVDSDADAAMIDALATAMDDDFEQSEAKRRKVSSVKFLTSVAHDEFPSFDDPEILTAKLAKRIPLDMNDPNLLLDVRQPSAADKRPPPSIFRSRKEAGGVSGAIHKKFNFSNDQEYERLVKENSVRGSVGNILIEHTAPARRLQYPFYKTELDLRELRDFHRPHLQVPPIHQKAHIGRRLGYQKIKEMRKLPVAEAFNQSKDLTLADNSSMLLLEYSEEHPLMLSNFGMNSRIVNYYRRKDEDDKYRPKDEIGETRLLQDKDQSPFAKFGFVDPGQTVPTIHNNLFRAPVFKHDANKTDFLIIRRQTGVHGVNWHMRNIENLHVVGQQFPFLEVPGTHGRKVTSTQKARMKMIAFRIYHKKLTSRTFKGHQMVPHDAITKHFPGSDTAQNRSKMREVMTYNKNASSWEPKPEDLRFLDMDLLRNEIKPEDICQIDSMQVGARQMEDAGFSTERIKADDAEDLEENASIDAQLVHWRATKNFLAACGDNAMIALHGEGDPTGRGEGLSFVKISMKGGFQTQRATANDRMNAERKKIQTGHRYNVRDQEGAYQSAIRQVWEAQAASLGSSETPELDIEMDDNIDVRIERNTAQGIGRTPRSEVHTPGYFPRDGDDSASHISGSRLSASDHQFASGRALKVTRRFKDKQGAWQEESQMIDDPVVARLYKKRHDTKRKALAEARVRGDVYDHTNGDLSREDAEALKAELLRLERNVERRKTREAQKAAKKRQVELANQGGDLNGEEVKPLPGQTLRKCANCGELGHIKTNKKLCPILNGRWPNGIRPDADGGTGAPTGMTTPIPESPMPGGPGAPPSRTLSTSFSF